MNLNIKKTLAAILAASMMICSSACSGEFFEDEFYEEEYSDNSADTLPQDIAVSDNENAEGSDLYKPSTLSLKLDEDGSLNISRSRKTNTVPMGEEGTWTIFVYLCGTDLESDNGMATMDLDEMLMASTQSNIRFIVQTGGTLQWDNDIVDPSKLQRYCITEGNIELVDEQELAYMSDSSTLADFLIWGVQSYGAANMGVVLWNHGGGSITGVCLDELTDTYDALSLREIFEAFSKASGYMTDTFEFVGFDACLMGTLECANILATYADYMYGSEETEPGYGWDYYAIGTFLDNDPYADGAELGKVVCDSFYESCEYIDQESAVTLSVIDLKKIDPLISAFNTFSENLYNASADSASLSSVIRAADKADNFGGNNKSEGYTNMVDLAGIVNAAAFCAEGGDEVLSALEDAVVYNVTGYEHSEACGLSTYYPIMIQGSSELAAFGDVAVNPYYLAFVDRVAYGSVNGGSINDYDMTDLAESWNSSFSSPDEVQQPVQSVEDYFDYYDDFEPTGESPLISFDTAPQLDDEGSYGFILTADALENTASVQANVFMLNEEEGDIIELGICTDIIADWDEGVFVDNFDGYWFALPDGQPLAVYIVSECDGYDVYTSPVMINGKETNLRITHNYRDDIITIDGAWDGIEDNGMAAREIYKLCEGDIILPLYYAFSIESDDEFTYEGAEYTYDGSSEIYYDLLYDSDYLYGFTIDDVYGDYYICDYQIFAVEDGEIYFYES